jgi:hypothetical protein
MSPDSTESVLRYCECDREQLWSLLGRYGLSCKTVPGESDIPGSYWGDSEAGLLAGTIVVRDDTPLHSILHEASHYVCMDESRRTGLHTDAGGDYDEENAVCYLQILLADELPVMGSARMMSDMDAWGYTFRLGSSRAWFERDAGDARDWLFGRDLIGADSRPNWKLAP